ncbi:MAG TPA: lysophospholipid acyltransferase family protein [Nitrospiria bacterium]|nr:lysophospholipid acyltransferase family protein [Nitrospiria bacterium]
MLANEGLSRDILRLIIWFPFRLITQVLPVRWGIFLLQMLGDIHYGLSRGRKRLLAENISRITSHRIDGKKEILAIREYFRNHYIDHLLIFLFPRFGNREIERFVEIEGIEDLNMALKGGRGVILVHGHFGPVHLPLVVLGRLGYNMMQIGLPSDEGLSWIGKKVAFRLRLKYEAKMPAVIIKADTFLRPVFKWLRENCVIMITGDGSGTDRRFGRHREFSFLGQRVIFPLGPAILADKTEAPIIPMFIIPGSRKPYKIIIERPLTSDRVGEEKILHITDQFINRLENYVQICPGFMHFLDRFSPGALIMEER